MESDVHQYRSVIKVNLRNIININYFQDNKYIESKINDTVIKVNKIVTLIYF